MGKILKLNRQIFIFGVPFLLIACLILLSKTLTRFDHPDTLSLAITFDLLITVPLIYYLLIRKTKIPKTTVVPILMLALFAGTYALPKGNQYYLDLFKHWALPLIEISIISFIIRKVYQSRKKYLKEKEAIPDFFQAIRETCKGLLPEKMIFPFATEIVTIYYAFINWKTPDLKGNEFTYHKKSGSVGLIVTFIFLILIETFALHLLLSKWSDTAAWILSGLSIYTAMQMFGLLRSLGKRPVTIQKDKLVLRYGIWAETEIPFENIEMVELSGKDPEINRLTKSLSPFAVLEGHNTIIKLNKENVLFGVYGIQKKYTVLLVHIDNKEEFKKQLEEARNK